MSLRIAWMDFHGQLYWWINSQDIVLPPTPVYAYICIKHITMKEIREWYAQKTNRLVDKFDGYDLHICNVIESYLLEHTEKYKSQSCPQCNNPFLHLIDNSYLECFECGFTKAK